MHISTIWAKLVLVFYTPYFVGHTIPAIVAFVELFFIMGRVDRYNEQKAQEIVTKEKLPIK